MTTKAFDGPWYNDLGYRLMVAGERLTSLKNHREYLDANIAQTEQEIRNLLAEINS